MIKSGTWYIHPGMSDTAIYVDSITSIGGILVKWYNISGRQRKFFIDMEFFMPEDFERSPLWQEQGDWIEELSTYHD